MARYTTELRDVVKSFNEHNQKLFDFEYTFIDDSFKSKLEENFINHFYFREIGSYPTGRFKHNLKIAFTENLPYYEELMKISLIEYDILNNYNVVETMEKNITGNLQQNDESESTATSDSTSQYDNKRVNSDTPASLLSMANIKGNLYASNVDIEDNTNTNNVNGHNAGTSQSVANSDSNENYTMTKIGNIGVMTNSDMLEKHIVLQQKLKTIYKQFFNECEDLFMQIF